MLDRPETAFLGLRGLVLAARKEGDEAAALEYAKRAYAIRPKTPWAATTLLDLQIGQNLWSEALTTLEAAIQHGILTGEDGRRRRVVVLLACSGAAGEAGQAKAALDFAKRASGLDPDFLPATLRHARAADRQRPQAAGGEADPGRLDPQPASRARAGSTSRLTRAEDAIGRMRRMERLAAHNAGHAESHLALAAAAVEAKLWATARRHFDQAEAAGHRDARLCRLRADAEEAEHGDTEAGAAMAGGGRRGGARSGVGMRELRRGVAPLDAGLRPLRELRGPRLGDAGACPGGPARGDGGSCRPRHGDGGGANAAGTGPGMPLSPKPVRLAADRAAPGFDLDRPSDLL